MAYRHPQFTVNSQQLPNIRDSHALTGKGKQTNLATAIEQARHNLVMLAPASVINDGASFR